MKNCLCFCAFVLLLCQSSIAQESVMADLDLNSDGKMSVDEFKTYASGKLEGYDQMDEFAAQVDSDGDGEINEIEFANRMQVLQKMADSASEKDEEGPLVAGDTAADFELQSLSGKVKLSDQFGEKGNPVVVVFSRANW